MEAADVAVTVEYRGWKEILQDHAARHGFELLASFDLTRSCVAAAREPVLANSQQGRITEPSQFEPQERLNY